MKFKIDESLHSDCARILLGANRDALTVYDQKINGASDTKLAQVCKREGQILISAYLDFSDVRNFPPQEHPGLIVIRSRNQSKHHQLELIKNIIPILDERAIHGYLWIVRGDKIRVPPAY